MSWSCLVCFSCLDEAGFTLAHSIRGCGPWRWRGRDLGFKASHLRSGSRLGLLRLEREVSSIGSRVRTRGLQLLVMFEKVVEPFKGGASLQEVGHWDWALRLFSPTQVHADFLPAEYGCFCHHLCCPVA